jgi:hypothetical protein
LLAAASRKERRKSAVCSHQIRKTHRYITKINLKIGELHDKVLLMNNLMQFGYGLTREEELSAAMRANANARWAKTTPERRRDQALKGHATRRLLRWQRAFGAGEKVIAAHRAQEATATPNQTGTTETA